MVFVVLVALYGFRSCSSASQVDFAAVLGANRADGKHALEILAAALRTRRDVALSNKLFEGVLAFAAGVFVNRHDCIGYTPPTYDHKTELPFPGGVDATGRSDRDIAERRTRYAGRWFDPK